VETRTCDIGSANADLMLSARGKPITQRIPILAPFPGYGETHLRVDSSYLARGSHNADYSAVARIQSNHKFLPSGSSAHCIISVTRWSRL